MKAFRLALVRQKYRPDGGAERFVSRALEALENQNIELNVITREWQGDINPDWNVHLCNPWKFGRVSRERGFANAARQIWQKEKFDLVQSHERIPGCDLYRAGDGVHVRWLEERSRLLPQYKAKRLFTDRFHRYVMQAEKDMYAAPELKAVICNAEMVKKEIIERFSVPAEKIHVIYNSVNNQHFIPATAPLRAQLRQQYGVPANATCMIYVGSGFERKGLDAAIKAISGTSRHLLVVGKDKNEPRYRELAAASGCKDRVHFFGVQQNTLQFYQMADGLLLPTLYDPFPNVILEAMACGLPVITTPTCGGAEFIENGRNGFVCDALDINDLQQAIMALPSNVVDSREFLNSRETVMNNTPQHLSEQLLNLYKELLNR